MMKVSLILEAINRATGPIRAVNAAVEKMGSVYTATTAKVTASAGRIAAATRVAGSRIMSLNDTVVDAGHHFRRLAGPEGMERASRSMAYLRNQVSGLSTGFSILKYAGLGAGIGLAEEFVRGVYTAGGESQRMLVTLTRLEGSALRARKAMTWMQTFAMGPGSSFSMPDIMRSYQMAKNFGMNPQGGSLAAFADLAAGERVPLKQILIAVKDAMEGTSTRPISNLGIKMKQGKGADGENSYLYSNLQGKFVTEHSAKTPEAVLATLVRIINSKYMGLATAQAKTVPGGFEQIKKLLYLFQMKVADAGVISWTLKQMNRFFGWVRQASADGSLDRLARQIAGFVTGTGDKLIRFLRETDWNAVGRDLKLLAASIVIVAGGLKMLAGLGGGGLSGLFNLWIASKVFGLTRALIGFWPALRAGATILRGMVPIIGLFGRALIGLVVAGGPVAWAIAGVALLAVGAFLLWRNWAKVSAWFRANLPILRALFGPIVDLPDLIRNNWSSIAPFFERQFARLNSLTLPTWMSLPAKLAIPGGGMSIGSSVGGWLADGVMGSSWGDMIRGGSPRPGPARPTGHPLLRDSPLAGTRATTVGGTMTIEFKNAPPHKVTRLESAHPGFALAVRRGAIRSSDQ